MIPLCDATVQAKTGLLGQFGRILDKPQTLVAWIPGITDKVGPQLAQRRGQCNAAGQGQGVTVRKWRNSSVIGHDRVGLTESYNTEM